MQEEITPLIEGSKGFKDEINANRSIKLNLLHHGEEPVVVITQFSQVSPVSAPCFHFNNSVNNCCAWETRRTNTEGIV